MTAAGRFRPRLPVAVVLPADDLIEHRHAMIAIAASRANFSMWRAKYEFPTAIRSGARSWILTDALAVWLARYGVQVRRL